MTCGVVRHWVTNSRPSGFHQFHAGFDDVVTHAGIDVMYVSEGSLVLVVDGVDYPVETAECAVWPSSHAHTVRNDGDVAAVAVGFTTEAVHR